MTRVSAIAVVSAIALMGCFHADFLQNTCEEQGGCPGATGSSSSGGPPTTSPPTTGEGTSTSTGTSTGTGTGTAGSSTTEAPPGLPFPGLAFRIKTIAIVDPDMYYKALNCLNVSDFVNAALQKSIDQRDSNVLLVARDYDPDAATQEFMLYRDADCPAGEDYCLLIDTVLPVKFISGNKDEGNCLDAMISTLNPENVDQLNLPIAPCVSSPNASVELELTPDLSPIKFYDGKFSAQYSPDDADPTALTNAILYGFVPQADAEMIVFTFMGSGINFWSVIRGSGHPDACQVPMDMLPGSVPDADMLDLDGAGPMAPVPGIFLYLNFSAERIDLYAPF